MKQVFLAILTAAIQVSCGPSTKIVKTWMEPGASVSQAADNKTLVIGMVKDATSRRVAEDVIVKRLNGKGVASYTILPEQLVKEHSEEILNQKLSEGKFTHVLMVRLADVEKETTYTPGTSYYGGYGRYYGYGAGFYSTPGYYSTDKNYFVETTVYSVNPNKLLWTGTTKTVNPGKIDKAINKIGDAITEKMKKERFLR